MNRLAGQAWWTALTLIATGAAAAITGQHSLAQEPPSWATVAPIFADNCVGCHSGEDAPLGLHLDSYAGAVAGGRDGPVLLPGDPANSELVQRLHGTLTPSMPLGGDPLPPETIALIESWIAAGLPEGAGAPQAPPAVPAATPAADLGPLSFAQIQPILNKRCIVCHLDGGQMGAPPEGLQLDSYEHLLAGGERVVVIPGNAGLSELVRRLHGTAQPRMPLNGPYLSEDEIALVQRWIAEGAKAADGTPAPVPVGAQVRFRGILTAEWALDGAPFTLGNARVDKAPRVGDQVELRGVVTADGSVQARRLRPR